MRSLLNSPAMTCEPSRTRTRYSTRGLVTQVGENAPYFLVLCLSPFAVQTLQLSEGVLQSVAGFLLIRSQVVARERLLLLGVCNGPEQDPRQGSDYRRNQQRYQYIETSGQAQVLDREGRRVHVRDASFPAGNTIDIVAAPRHHKQEGQHKCNKPGNRGTDDPYETSHTPKEYRNSRVATVSARRGACDGLGDRSIGNASIVC